MTSGAWVIELAQKSWAEMSADERQVFSDWLRTAEGRDLYLIVRYAMRFRQRSSQQKMKAVQGSSDDSDDD